jgi:Na+/H+ antiporter NhaC
MNERTKLAIYTLSALISLAHLVLSFIVVTHIFGLLMSAAMIIVNVLVLIYEIKVKKQISSDYKVQYEMMGRKQKDTCLNSTIYYGSIVLYITINLLMVIMIVLRSISFTLSESDINFNEFPYMCDPQFREGCTRMVLVKNSCKGVETI